MTKRKDWTIPDHYDPDVSAKELADLFGLTAVRIQQLAKEDGLPKRAHGRYPLKRACQWIRDYWKSKATGGDEAEVFRAARNRKLAAEAQIAEAKLEKARGNTIPVDFVAPCWEGAATVAADAFDGFEDRLCVELHNAKTPRRIAQILRTELDRILIALAEADIEIEIEE